ncbi:hypothetical protein KQI82_01915 [Oscillibacter sp. MSJ-2]|uniref:Uncharacterized protein n=1 Tax=Dysosmobacter acutus TaxID=2841504 RepID=A0ABS6F7Q8_9FIRM|nr:hypothetical protein [Dysosmobacter acutus]MBU5625691.1 hypothetical protein [Dysosmobacter acutus]
MLDEKDLQAIAALIKAETEPLREEIKLIQNKVEPLQEEIKRTKSESIAMMEAYFEPKFDLLADSIMAINEKLDTMPTKEDLEPLELRIDALEAIVRKHSREIAELKKAQ